MYRKKPTFPMDARETLVHFAKCLLDYEKSEILDYDTIYYLNVQERPSNKPLTTPDGPENGGFDNDKSEYICDVKDHISYRYEVKKHIGKGSFGQVFQCLDHKTGAMVALKILRNKKRLYK
jgi:dual specificity tyrosine-phosphorylation-regulated kinase 2/3/4